MSMTHDDIAAEMPEIHPEFAGFFLTAYDLPSRLKATNAWGVARQHALQIGRGEIVPRRSKMIATMCAVLIRFPHCCPQRGASL